MSPAMQLAVCDKQTCCQLRQEWGGRVPIILPGSTPTGKPSSIFNICSILYGQNTQESRLLWWPQAISDHLGELTGNAPSDIRALTPLKQTQTDRQRSKMSGRFAGLRIPCPTAAMVSNNRATLTGMAALVAYGPHCSTGRRYVGEP